jgi:tetratricopeptide (TPR) repeat protein
MSKQTAASLFILSPYEANAGELYQALLGGIGSHQQLGERLIRLAERAYAFRQFDQVKAAGRMLSNVPLKHYRAIGHYYLAVGTNSKGSGDQDKARRLFELAIDTAPDDYKVKGVLSLGALAYNRRDFDAALYFYRQAIKAGRLSTAGIQAVTGSSIVKAVQGDHAQALRDLEGILPVVKYAPAHVYFDILNSYAVELGEAGRKGEARNIIRTLLASPLAFAYPEWHETAADLKPARSSFVALGPSAQYNVQTLPEPERGPTQQPAPPPKPARVLNFAKWKKKLEKRAREKQADQLLEEMSIEDMGLRLFELITENQPDWDQMRTILTFVMNLFAGPARPPDKPSA